MDEVTQAINHFSVLMEDQNGKLDAVLEAVGDIRAKVEDLPTRDEFNELKRDVKTIKAAVTDLSRDLKQHKSLPAHVAHGHA
jgi:archaellum component FlaC